MSFYLSTPQLRPTGVEPLEFIEDPVLPDDGPPRRSGGSDGSVAEDRRAAVGTASANDAAIDAEQVLVRTRVRRQRVAVWWSARTQRR
ncbi:hypothetical protein [Aquihabitans sp. McL0605]|uniref:hypothetical protein n=1 Tax=Aquihabitans sp. McL0605 TaxID=3415671 RepID=UPI003CF52DAB